ncbi:MAG: methyltransferase [Flavobacteriales bacterium CG_4_9_14_3_um_filter_40_17]|nr:MAG: methyltransferase [Flavobacteriales bacterium CG_4_9_14_3_um_filter_40_17]
MYEKSFPKKRFDKTLDFLKTHIKQGSIVLDLGVKNPFSEIMQDEGYRVFNTQGEDLDRYTESVLNPNIEVVTAFEIFEHLLSPFSILSKIKARKLVATVPLRLWFSPAYRSKTDPWDRHFHEFEDWQFDWLLEKAGWEIKARKKWTHPAGKIGFRPLLRHFTPRYYAVYAERKKS